MLMGLVSFPPTEPESEALDAPVSAALDAPESAALDADEVPVIV
jgi:hypothetical protein